MAPATRNSSIDLLRYVLLILVIIIHVLSSMAIDTPSIGQLVVLSACSCAVPAYFIAAGYFLKWRQRSLLAAVTHPLIRLAPAYLFWMAVYFVVDRATAAVRWHYGVRDILSGGPAYHLWFLPALMAALILVGVVAKAGGLRSAAALSAILAVVGLSRGAYHDLLALPGGAARGGLLIAPLFVCIGAGLAERPIAIRRAPAIAFIAAAWAIQVGEHLALAQWHSTGPAAFYPFTLSTIPLGIAVFIGGISVLPRDLAERAAWLTRSTLGAYSVHLLVLWSVLDWISAGTIGGALAVLAITFLVSSALSLAMATLPLLDRVVR